MNALAESSVVPARHEAPVENRPSGPLAAAPESRSSWTRGAVILLTLITLGSGLLNLESVIGPALPERYRLVRETFPLEFIRASRFITLVTGFALVIVSINIRKRKKRAWQAATFLAASSVVFHLTKGLDYEEATVSAILLALLWWARRAFTVRSGAPDWRSRLLGLTVAGALAAGYGVAGFWLLEPREFGLDFTIGDAIRRTFLILTFADPGLAPKTHYAVWFLNSLHVMMASAVGYSCWQMFRPALYRFHTYPHERQRAAGLVAAHGRSTLDFFKVWPDKSFFFTPGETAFVAYRVANGFAVVLGDPVGPEEEAAAAIAGFRQYCEERDWGVAFYQAMPDFMTLYRAAGFNKLKIGDDAIVDLDRFTIEGKRGKEFRSKVNQFERVGTRTKYYEPPIDAGVLAALREVSDDWLRIPGRRERGFTLGSFEEDYLRRTPIMTAEAADGRVLAFLNVIPGGPGESTCDLMRRRSDAPNGIMDYLFVKMFQLAKERGYRKFNLGMAPMSGFQEREEASAQERAVHAFFQHLNFLFSYKGLRAYKAKFATNWEPRFVYYHNVLDLPRLALALGKVSAMKEQ
ncbi:MAG TPA: phosphatidylglycerol lysyltransferase domain-containing protein [Bryobacteraceae bacterium]|nr:phosphatidylglycerol lysyltransferase domain-containing protein [Bryobacteraceae bacterium]